MNADSAQTWVKVFAILNWVSGVFGIFLGILLLFISPFIGALAQEMSAEEGIVLTPAELASFEQVVYGVVIGLGILLIILSVLSIFIGFGVWRQRRWGRILSIISLWIGAAWIVVQFILSLAGGDIVDIFVQFLMLLIAGGITAFFLWLFHKEPNVQALFRPVTKKPAAKKKA